MIEKRGIERSRERKKKGNGHRERKKNIDVEVIRTDGICSCQIEHTSSS